VGDEEDPVIVQTPYPALVPAIRRAGYEPVVVCPGCGAPARDVTAVTNGEPAFRCDGCDAAWMWDADIETLKEVLRRAGKL
jgi:hypothetical protein